MALYVPDGDGFAPTPFSTGPWRADAQHGGPPAALMGRGAEAVLEDDEVVVRVGVELLRPVPMSTLRLAIERRQSSRRVAHISSSLLAGDELVATSTTLVLRGGDLPRAAWEPSAVAEPVPGPDRRVQLPAFALDAGTVGYHRDAVEQRLTSGGFDPGPAVAWIRLLEPLVEGEVTSPLCRLLAVADFGSGISAIYPPGGSTGLINADLTVALLRPPAGEWVRVDAVSRANDRGTGLAVSEIGDVEGFVGVATQSLLGITS